MHEKNYNNTSDQILDIDIFESGILDEMEENQNKTLPFYAMNMTPEGFEVTNSINKIVGVQNCSDFTNVDVDLSIDFNEEHDGFLDLKVKIKAKVVKLPKAAWYKAMMVGALLSSCDSFMIDATKEQSLEFAFIYNNMYQKIEQEA